MLLWYICIIWPCSFCNNSFLIQCISVYYQCSKCEFQKYRMSKMCFNAVLHCWQFCVQLHHRKLKNSSDWSSIQHVMLLDSFSTVDNGKMWTGAWNILMTQLFDLLPSTVVARCLVLTFYCTMHFCCKSFDNHRILFIPHFWVGMVIIFELTPRDHISPSLLQLHWLPVCWHIEYKLCCIMHSVHTGRCSAYMKNTVQLAAARQSRSDLRSLTTSAYLLPQLKTKFGERAFSHADPSTWNALPTHIRDNLSLNSFRKLLKTHFFSLAFNVY